MNPTTGKFTASLDGHYYFTFQGTDGNAFRGYTMIFLNGQKMSSDYFSFPKDYVRL